ncbi:MAG: hypothetical protein IPF92_06930 [Myxococcales bacterium]|nr:hypothetical protein [Myxococcales bacterium]MBL0192774.1 hypothetical protein [Myxococcales bacterium]
MSLRRHVPRGARARLVAATLAALLGAPREARAADPPSSTRTGYSPYEQATISDTLKRTGFVAEPGPDGKIIESVEIVRLEVIEPRDPAPAFLNAVHTTSKDYVIRRELLQRPGEAFATVIADETERNMRRLFQISLVVVLAVKGSDDRHVRVLVITKDVWSLRLSYDLALTSGGLETLTIVPQETNLFGLHHTARTQFTYKPESLTFGLGYKVPRVRTTWIGASADLGVTVNRRSGEAEGYVAKASVAQPLYSTRAPWAWGAGVDASQGVVRRYSQAKLFIDPRTGVPFEYNARSVGGTASATRSFGWRQKLDVSFGYGLTVAKNEVDPARLAAYGRPIDPVKLAAFERANLPIAETRSGPFLQGHAYTTNFLTVTDFRTLGLQEDFRLGHDVYVHLYPVLQGLGSTRDLLGAYLGAQYTWALRDGMVRTSIESTTELQLGGDTRLSDASIEGGLHVVTPRLGFGRLVFSAAAANRYENYLNRQSFLGGEGRLRGYPSSFFNGKDFVVGNLEYRSRALEILSVLVGGVLFYDVGDTMNGFDRLRPKQSLGGGLRFLFPQLNRAVFRTDLGFPMDRGPFTPGAKPVDPVNFYFAFEQAFGFGGVGP